MKILMFSDSYGGITTTFIRNIVKALIELDNEVLYVCSDLISSNYNNHPNFSTIRIPKELSTLQKILFKIRKDEYSRFYLKKRILHKKYNEILVNYKPDIIYCHFFNEALYLLENISIEGLNIFCHIHGYDASKLLVNNSYKYFINKYNKKREINFLFVANALKFNLEKSINKKIQRAHLLHCGIDTSFFQRKAPNKILKIYEFKVIHFIQISSLTEKKGHHYSLQAFAIFKKHRPDIKFKFIICGDGPLSSLLVQVVKDLKLEEDVLFVGNVTPIQAREYLLKSHVFIHHSITSKSGDQEGIPTSIMEAMSVGLPVISTKHSGITELITDNVYGLLNQEKEVSQIVSSIEKILQYPSYIPSSVNRIEKFFSLKNYSIEFQKITRKLTLINNIESFNFNSSI